MFSAPTGFTFNGNGSGHKPICLRLRIIFYFLATLSTVWRACSEICLRLFFASLVHTDFNDFFVFTSDTNFFWGERVKEREFLPTRQNAVKRYPWPPQHHHHHHGHRHYHCNRQQFCLGCFWLVLHQIQKKFQFISRRKKINNRTQAFPFPFPIYILFFFLGRSFFAPISAFFMISLLSPAPRTNKLNATRWKPHHQH